MTTERYSALMGEGKTYIEIKIENSQPVELGDFLSAFASISGQYDRHIRRSHPDDRSYAKIFVKEVRAGSIIAELFACVGSIIGVLDQALITEQFVRTYGERISRYFGRGGRAPDASASELKDFEGTVAAVANDPHGRGAIAAIHIKDGAREVRAVVEFNSKQANIAREEIQNHRREIGALESADKERVLMVFKRTDKGSSTPGRRSGERVIIESISSADLPLIYASRLAEDRIKDVLREPDENIYHKGFVVDVNIEYRAGKPIAYRVVNVQQVIELDNT